jgi:aryl-alcohol dehydrogenase-like predicted oxidoreductase
MTDMQYRTLGRTGERVSAIGVGGFHLSVPPEAEAIRIVRSAIDAGVNFLDNSWDYADGESERRMGQALRGGYRDNAFLMTKMDGRTAESALRQFEESLRRLQTDHVDLLQIHELIRLDDIGRILGPGGALEALLRAREQGKLRYIGFTGHKSPHVHKAMLEAAFRAGFTFDAVQMPLNVMDAHFDSFERIVLPMLVRHEIGVLGMKAMGDKYILESGVVTPIECLHYALSLPTSVVITGIDSMPILEQALTAVRSFVPLTPEQRTALLAKTAKPARDGMFERYKTTDRHDATERHPEWVA